MPSQITPALHLYDRAARRPHPGYARGLSFTAQPYPDVPSLAKWLKANPCKSVMLVDIMGMYPLGAEPPCEPGGGWSFSRWRPAPNASRTMATKLIRDVLEVVEEVRLFYGPPPCFVEYPKSLARLPGVDATLYMMQCHRELADMLKLGARPTIDTGGGHLSEKMQSPLGAMLTTKEIRDRVDLEGWNDTTPEHSGLVTLIPDRAEQIVRVAPLSPCCEIWLQGSMDDQRRNFDYWLARGVTNFAAEPTVFGNRWQAFVEEMA